MLVKIVLTLIIIIIVPSECARILAIMPTPSYSHHIVYNPLWLALHARGHQITLFSTDPLNINSTNFRQINWKFVYELWHIKHNVSDIIKNYRHNMLKSFNQYTDMSNDILSQELKHPEVQEIYHNPNEHFDLVIGEIFTPLLMVFSHRFNCPFIGVSPMDIPNFVHEAIGNPTGPALFVELLVPFDANMNLFERLANTIYYLATKMYCKYYIYQHQMIANEIFGEDIPKLQDLLQNISILFMNTNPILHDIRPLMPNVVVVGGGLHYEEKATLPSDIQSFLDQANDGAIYFSLGTNVKSEDLPAETKRAFLEAFSELPYKVIWKFQEKDLKDSDKMMVKSWLPQQNILKHPNIKLFITQGGIQSLEEAIYNAIPIIGMPGFVDQLGNVRRMVHRGVGVALDLDNLDKIRIKDAIQEVITNEKYKRNCVELSSLIKERPIAALDEEIYWIEYVIKNKGAKLLSRPHIPLYQYLLLDVMAVLLLILLSVIGIWYWCAVVAIKHIRRRRFKRRYKLE